MSTEPVVEVPRIACGKCGHDNHIDATTGEFQGRCSQCYAFLRRPTDAEREQMVAFVKQNSEAFESEEAA